VAVAGGHGPIQRSDVIGKEAMEALGARRTLRGKMLWFNEEKRHGYIATDEGERLYVDVDGFGGAPPQGSCAGLLVEFELGEGPDGRQAQNAQILTPVSPRRARRRGNR
jgi:cold shock CspA family protein